jgi:hypothetical protein
VACMRSRLASKWLELVDYGIGVLRVVEYDGVKADCGVGALPIKGFTHVAFIFSVGGLYGGLCTRY